MPFVLAQLGAITHQVVNIGMARDMQVPKDMFLKSFKVDTICFAEMAIQRGTERDREGRIALQHMNVEQFTNPSTVVSYLAPAFEAAYVV